VRADAPRGDANHQRTAEADSPYRQHILTDQSHFVVTEWRTKIKETKTVLAAQGDDEMLRIIVQTSDCSMAANIGGHVENTVRTFDVDVPELESYLREHKDAPEPQRRYRSRDVIGIELLATTHPRYGEGEMTK
jgi:hypothetical protein